MLVSGGGLTHWRTEREGEISRNGSFIDVHYIRDGIRDWISIPEDALRNLLDLPGHGKFVKCSIGFDEPADERTILVEFLMKSSVRQMTDVLDDKHHVG